MSKLQPQLDEKTIASIVTQTVDEFGSHNVFSFSSPRQTLIGEGSILKIGNLLQSLGVKRVLIVADQVIYQKGLLASTLRCLARVDIEVALFTDIKGEPTPAVVERGLTVLKQSKTDFVLGFGGGSAMDAAKVIAVLASHNCSLATLAEPNLTGSRTIGLGAVPTTAGTGSETTDISVILQVDRPKKILIQQAGLMPDVAIIDPALMLDLPAEITSATGIDALTHSIEAYVATGTNAVTQALAIAAIKEIFHALPVAVGNGRNMPARLSMAGAAYKAGMAFNNAGLGLVHAIAHQLGARYGIAHGVANGVLLPHVMRFNALVCRREYAEIARSIGVTPESTNDRQQCNDGILAVRQLMADIGLPNNLAEFGAREQDFPDLANDALQDSCLQTNPRSVVKENVIQILKQAMCA